MNFLLETEYFVCHETLEQDFQGIKFSTISSQSISWAMKPQNKTWFAQGVFGSISFPYLSLSNMNNVHNTYLVATLIHVVKSSISLNILKGFPTWKNNVKFFSCF